MPARVVLHGSITFLSESGRESASPCPAAAGETSGAVAVGVGAEVAGSWLLASLRCGISGAGVRSLPSEKVSFSCLEGLAFLSTSRGRRDLSVSVRRRSARDGESCGGRSAGASLLRLRMGSLTAGRSLSPAQQAISPLGASGGRLRTAAGSSARRALSRFARVSAAGRGAAIEGISSGALRFEIRRAASRFAGSGVVRSASVCPNRGPLTRLGLPSSSSTIQRPARPRDGRRSAARCHARLNPLAAAAPARRGSRGRRGLIGPSRPAGPFRGRGGSGRSSSRSPLRGSSRSGGRAGSRRGREGPGRARRARPAACSRPRGR